MENIDIQKQNKAFGALIPLLFTFLLFDLFGTLNICYIKPNNGIK